MAEKEMRTLSNFFTAEDFLFENNYGDAVMIVAKAAAERANRLVIQRGMQITLKDVATPEQKGHRWAYCNPFEATHTGILLDIQKLEGGGGE